MAYQIVGYANRPDVPEVMDSEYIRHLDHPHRLKLAYVDRYLKCEICKTNISRSLAFACERCYYAVCRSCAKLPSQMKHPFHPQHTLILLEKRSAIGCRACGLITDGYLYDCEQCTFCLDLRCSALMPTKKTHKDQEPHVIKHPHPFIVCDKPEDSDHFGCRLCFESFKEEDLIYACLECICLMDEDCAKQPSEIKHPFHPEHNLNLRASPPEDSSRCLACSQALFRKDVVYHCPVCNVVIDFHCAGLMPVLESSGPEEQGALVRPASHPHPLMQCYISRKNFHHKCYACGLPFKDSVYVCPQCRILLHKSCADLPRKIAHRFHPQHPLVLYETPTDPNVDSLYRSYECGACENGHGDFVYACQDCDFLLDIRCATADLLMVKSTVHQHSLALVDFHFRYRRCNVCYRGLEKDGFRCVPCNFNIHVYCHPSLPKTIKHECHCDPLTLTTKRIKDYVDEDEDDYDYDYQDKELYCTACEETRDLADPTYYCQECHFVAHIRCVFSEILPCLEITSEKLVEEVEDIKPEPSATVANVGNNLETGGISGSNEKDEKLQLAQKLSEEILALKEEIDLVSKRIDEQTDKRNNRCELLQHKLNQKTHLTGKKHMLPGFRQPVYIGYDESAKVTVSYIY